MIGIHRRELLQVGYSGAFGLGMLGIPQMTALARPNATLKPKSPKSMIFIFLTGAASHIDTFDPKPDAPAEIRGEFTTIPTKIPGYRVTELLPKLAERADKYAIIRTLSHKDNNHLVASHHVQTGHQQPGAFFDKVASRDDWPSYAAGLNYLRPRTDGLPTGVNLPWYLREQVLTWPGQHAGFLGPKHDPWQIDQNPNSKNFRVENLSPMAGLDVDQFADRRALLGNLDQQQAMLERIAETKKLTDQQDAAFRLLTRAKSARPSICTANLTPCATAMVATPSANRCSWPVDSCKRACRSCKPTWAKCKTGTLTATSLNGSKTTWFRRSIPASPPYLMT